MKNNQFKSITFTAIGISCILCTSNYIFSSISNLNPALASPLLAQFKPHLTLSSPSFSNEQCINNPSTSADLTYGDYRTMPYTLPKDSPSDTIEDCPKYETIPHTTPDDLPSYSSESKDYKSYSYSSNYILCN